MSMIPISQYIFLTFLPPIVIDLTEKHIDSFIFSSISVARLFYLDRL